MCDCAKKMNDKLAEDNARLAFGFYLSDSGMKLTPPMISVEKIDPKKRGKVPSIIANYCPFCGNRYEQV
jgi:hypothetical protein